MTCKRVIISKPGGINSLQVIEDDVPEPRPHEVRIRVKATGISYQDIILRQGNNLTRTAYPCTPGTDVVGIIDKLGDQVSSLACDQPVAALTLQGACSEYVCVPAAHAVPVPPELDPALLEPIVHNYLCAYQMLHRCARMSPKSTALVHGAGGGIGTAILDLSRLLQLKTFGTDNAQKHHIIKKYDATPIDFRKQRFMSRIRELAPGGVDAVFDPMGGEHWRHSYKCLAPCGKLVLYGIRLAEQRQGMRWWHWLKGNLSDPNFSASKLFFTARGICGYNVALFLRYHPEWYRQDLKQLVALLKSQKIKPTIAEKLSLDKVREAHQLYESGEKGGRIVLLI